MKKDQQSIAALAENPLYAEVGIFLDYLLVERGLADNTAINYRFDLADFCTYLWHNGISSWTSLKRQDIINYLLHLKEQGRVPATLARHMAAVKSLCHYLAAEKIMMSDPGINLETPKKAMVFPQVLSQEQVAKLLEAPQNDVYGLRDKAMLELLYATGMRVSELLQTDMGDIQMDFGYVRTIGKGAKERIIPIGHYALEAIDCYVDTARQQLLHTKKKRRLVFKRARRPFNQAGVLEDIKTVYDCARFSPRDHTAYAAPFRGYPFAGERRGSKGGAGTFGACRYRYHADLYPFDQRPLKNGLRHLSSAGEIKENV